MGSERVLGRPETEHRGDGDESANSADIVAPTNQWILIPSIILIPMIWYWLRMSRVSGGARRLAVGRGMTRGV